MKQRFFGFLILFISLNANAQIAPKYSNEFLRLGVGARAISMGGAVLTTSQSPYSGFWNPALILNTNNKFELAYMHSEYFAGIANYDFFGGTYQIDENSSLGLSFIRFGIDNIPNTLELYDDQGNIKYDRVSYFSAIDNAFLISYAKKSSIEGLDIGGNVKIIRRTTGKFASAWGFGFDLAGSYVKDKWKAGLVLKDVTSTFNAWSFSESELKDAFELTGNELPENALELTLPTLSVGISRSFKTVREITFSPELAFTTYFDGEQNTILSSSVISLDPYLGLEADYKNVLYIRGGINKLQKIEDFDKERLAVQPNFGLGLKFKRFAIDYAIANFANNSFDFYSHIFSLSYSFDSLF